MDNYINQIKEKIKNKIEIEDIKIIDNSHLHKSHSTYQKGKLHLTLEIQSNYLKKMKRVEAERALLSVIKEDFEKKIHALEIKLK